MLSKIEVIKKVSKNAVLIYYSKLKNKRNQIILDIHFEYDILALFDKLSPFELTKYIGFFEYVDFWPEILVLGPKQHVWRKVNIRY